MNQQSSSLAAEVMSNFEAAARRVECSTEAYHSDYARLSNSMLSEFIRSPERYRAIVNGEIKRRQTDAMRVGSLLHSAMEGQRLVYTPEEFDDAPPDWQHLRPEDVIEWPESLLSKRGNGWALLPKNSPKRQAFEEEHAGRVLMKRDEVRGLERYHDWLRSVGQAVICKLEEYDQVQGMAESLRSHPWIKEQLAAEEQEHEFTIEWTNELGIPCKARIDHLQRIPRVIDWKKTRDARLSTCAATAWKYGYHRQQAFYVDGLAEYLECEPADVQFAFAFVEDEAPYCVSVVELDPVSMVDVGRQQNLEAMRRLLECRESGRYRRPGSNEVVTISAPRWAKYEEEYSYGD